MRFLTLVVFSMMLGAQLASAAGGKTWSFDTDAPDKPPEGWTFARTGGGPPGQWVVKADPDARSGKHVLAQLDADATDNRFPLAVADAPLAKDLRLSVKCKSISGKVDQACGLVFRYQDENNYYITRANPLEDNVRLYHVKDGNRQQLASWKGPVKAGVWHELAIEAKGERLQVLWNGKKILEAKDRTFSKAGKVGLWTKADSVTYFDDLTITPN
jgi:hypothetical protein